MSYLVAVLSDRLQAEAAYTALEKQGLDQKKVTILGRGYKSAKEFNLFDPSEIALQRSKLMALWLVPFGFLGGIGFGLATNLETFAWAGTIGDKIVGGLLGAIGGAMGSIMAGGSIGTILGRSDCIPYSQRLEKGEYIVVVKGSPLIIQQATTTLRRFSPDNLQNYNDPDVN